MKNVILLILFFIGIAVMANEYFIPRMDTENNVDFLDAELREVIKIIPQSDTLYYISTDATNDAEMRYKTLFALVPRTMVIEKSGIIPKGTFMLQVRDKSIPQKASEKDTVFKNSQQLYSGGNRFTVTLLKKN